jgi:hypothetical protein
MNFRLLLCVSLAMVVAFLALFQIIDRWRAMKAPPRAIPEPPSFQTTVIRYQDPQGKEVERESQFQITTKFADEDTLKKLPPPPQAVTGPTSGGE